MTKSPIRLNAELSIKLSGALGILNLLLKNKPMSEISPVRDYLWAVESALVRVGLEPTTELCSHLLYTYFKFHEEEEVNNG